MLGICCHFLKEETKPKSGVKHLINEMDERTLQLGRYQQGKYSEDQIRATYINNVRNLSMMLPKIRQSGVRLFRISSAMFPLADKVDRKLWDNEYIHNILRSIGDYVKRNDMRVTVHPGQFCVLSSDSDSVVENAFTELSMHGWLFDAMGLDHSPKYSINIHGGKKDRITRLTDQIKSLPDCVRKRLTLENDENSYGVADLLPVFLDTGTPICFDSHHHVFNDNGLSMDDAFYAACETWPKDIKPLQHISNTEPSLMNGSFTVRRKHSDMIHYVPDCQLKSLRDDLIDVEVEAKMKNISVLHMSKKFLIPL